MDTVEEKMCDLGAVTKVRVMYQIVTDILSRVASWRNGMHILFANYGYNKCVAGMHTSYPHILVV